MATKKKTTSSETTSRRARKPAKKTTQRKKTSTKQKSAGFIGELKKIGIGIAVLAAICLTTAMIADLYFHPARQQDSVVVKSPSSQVPAEKESLLKAEKKQSAIKKRKDLAESGLPVEEKQKKTILKEKKTEESAVGQSVEMTKTKDPAPLKVKKQSQKIQKEKAADIPVYEVFHEAGSDTPSAIVKNSKKSGKLPRISVIIDDIGFDKKVALGLCDVSSRITFSVLPWSPFGKYLAEKLAARGASIMLHLPMEPMGYPRVDPGPGALLAEMEPDVLLEQLRKDLGAIPHITGVNNHMGSRLTTSASQMNQVFTILKKEGLFFIDSRTAVDSQCASSARLLQIPFAERDIFLDNVQNVSYISKQFALLVRIAKKHGSAIGIGHPYKETLKALAAEIPKLKGKVEIVPAQDLVHLVP